MPLWLCFRFHFHLYFLNGIDVAFPRIPDDTVKLVVGHLSSFVIFPIEITGVAIPVPPRAMERIRTVATIWSHGCVIIDVLGGESEDEYGKIK